jgi:hypothetical protein
MAALDTPTLDKVVELIVGDWSGDGHDKKESCVIKSTHDGKDIEKFYQAGVKKLKCDPAQEVAEYEASTLCADTVKKLVAAGFECRSGDEVNKDGTLDLWTTAYEDVYMFVAVKGSKGKLVWERNDSAGSHVNIGGYGLFE